MENPSITDFPPNRGDINHCTEDSPKIKPMQIRQLSVSYLADQDRIVMRVHTSADEEIPMWLTRRMCSQLWPLLNRIATDLFAVPPNAVSDGGVDLNQLSPETRQMLVDMQRQEALQNADFSASYQGASAKRPLGDTPLLVTEVNITPQPHKTNGQLQLQLHFKEVLENTPQVRGFEVVLSSDLVFSVMHLLESALTQSEWGIHATSPLNFDSESDFDLTDDGKRPMYLN